MRRTGFCAGLLLVLAVSVSASSVEERAAESRKAVREFSVELKKELFAALKAGGPTNAVQVCSQNAPDIADRISRSRGWEVGRTSLRIRNSVNAPDEWEKKTLEAFEERRSRGEEIGDMEHAEVVTEGGKRFFRYMKAIPAGKLCLTCHGKKLDPDLVEKLKRLYPQDRATGFSLGEIRGAFTIRQPM